LSDDQEENVSVKLRIQRNKFQQLRKGRKSSSKSNVFRANSGLSKASRKSKEL
jgi:hypothetical protein